MEHGGSFTSRSLIFSPISSVNKKKCQKNEALEIKTDHPLYLALSMAIAKTILDHGKAKQSFLSQGATEISDSSKYRFA